MSAEWVLTFFILAFNSLIELVQLGILINNRLRVEHKIKEQEKNHCNIAHSVGFYSNK